MASSRTIMEQKISLCSRKRREETQESRENFLGTLVPTAWADLEKAGLGTSPFTSIRVANKEGAHLPGEASLVAQ